MTITPQYALTNSYTTIRGGESNEVCGSFSVVAGGSSNNIFSNNSAILGGVGNIIPAGLNFAGVFGNAVTAVNSNSLHLENVWLKPGAYCSHPGYTGVPFLPGTIYIDTLTPGFPLRIVP